MTFARQIDARQIDASQIDASLRTAYQAMLQEPVPDRFAQLLAQLKAQDAQPSQPLSPLPFSEQDA